MMTPEPSATDVSTLLINLLKGVQYRDQDETQWGSLLSLQSRVRDYMAALNLELVLDESEGYAFIKSRPEPDDDDPSPRLPRLVARRPLSFAVSLMLALLRKKLAEFDAGGSGTRLILSRDDLVEMVRVFLPQGSNEARLVDQVDANINKLIDLGFLQRLKAATGAAASGQTGALAHYEVRRILKAFVDAQWLAEFDQQLAQYRAQLSGDPAADQTDTDA